MNAVSGQVNASLMGGSTRRADVESFLQWGFSHIVYAGSSVRVLGCLC